MEPRLYLLNAVMCPYVCNGGRGQLSRQRRHNENDVIMIIAAAYGDMAIGDMWPRVATL